MLWRGFQKPKRLAVDAETLTEKFGKFSAQPFERGFGTTIGNALRRTLLSSIEGAAVTAVRIEEVLHEFQSIGGVVEDATDIILNLKQIPFKLNGDGPKALYLRADQPGVVTSGMIEADGIGRQNCAVGPHFEGQLVVIGDLSETGGFDEIVHAANRRVDRIHGDEANA